MWFILFILIFMIEYIVSFKDDFSKEHIDKVALALALVLVVAILLGIISSL